MARHDRKMSRDAWWETRLKEADAPKRKVAVLQSKILADIAKLPEQHQDAARELTALTLANLVDEIQIKVAEEVWA